VLADDPGSGVLTLTCFGMAQRSRSGRHGPSPIIARWKDSASGTREISLDPGAHGVLLTLCGERTTRRSADGRGPVRTGTHYYQVAVNQITAAQAGSQLPSMPSAISGPLVLEVEDLTILTGWAEGVAEALAHAPARAGGLLDDAQAGASWRTAFAIPEPSPRLSEGIDSIREAVAAATPIGGAPSFDALLNSVRQDRADEPALGELVRRVLQSTLEQVRTRQATQGDDRSHRP
jgi:hypothetical protein